MVPAPFKPHSFLKQYFNRFASSDCKVIYGELRKSFYELFDLRFTTQGCSYSSNGEVDGPDLVIKNKESCIGNYHDLINKMEDLLGDRFDKPQLPKHERVSSKSATDDWRQNVLDKLIQAMNWRSSLKSYLLATFDEKEIPACLIECGMEHLCRQPTFCYNYYKDFKDDNCDHILSIKNTFNGPTIWLPASWDKEVCLYFFLSNCDSWYTNHRKLKSSQPITVIAVLLLIH